MTLEVGPAASLRSDPHLSQAERIGHLQNRFDLMWRYIADGNAHLFNLNRMSSGGLAHEAVGQIAKMLRLGTPSPQVLELLTDCLAREHPAFTTFTVAAIRSGRGNSPVHVLIAEYVEMKDESACLSLLRIAKPPHRPREEDRDFRMLEAYMCAIGSGASDEDAIAGAYAARGGWDIEKDRTTFKARGIRKMTVYDYRVSEKLRPFLRKYGRDNTYSAVDNLGYKRWT